LSILRKKRALPDFDYQLPLFGKLQIKKLDAKELSELSDLISQKLAYTAEKKCDIEKSVSEDAVMQEPVKENQN
jgi:hypothetical protein